MQPGIVNRWRDIIYELMADVFQYILKVKRIALFILLAGYSDLLYAQTFSNFPGFIFRWSGGYGWAPNAENIPAPVINTLTPATDKFGNLANINAPNASNQVVHNSFGHGFNTGLRFGYMFNQYIGVDMGVYYDQSKTISAYQQTILYQPDSANQPVPSGGYLDNQITCVSRSLVLSPSVIVAFSKPKYKFYPYLRAGAALPVFTQVTNNLNMVLNGVGATTITNSAPYFLGDITTATYQTVTLFTAGFTGAVGVVYRPVNFINFFAEVNGQYLNVKGSYTLLTQWTADGTDQLSNRGPYREETVYVKSLNGQSNNIVYNPNYNPNQPKQDVSPVFPFSYIGFNIGVQLVLNKTVFKDLDGFDQDRSKKVKTPKKKKKKQEEPKPGQ